MHRRKFNIFALLVHLLILLPLLAVFRQEEPVVLPGQFHHLAHGQQAGHEPVPVRHGHLAHVQVAGDDRGQGVGIAQVQDVVDALEGEVGEGFGPQVVQDQKTLILAQPPDQAVLRLEGGGAATLAQLPHQGAGALEPGPGGTVGDDPLPQVGHGQVGLAGAARPQQRRWAALRLPAGVILQRAVQVAGRHPGAGHKFPDLLLPLPALLLPGRELDLLPALLLFGLAGRAEGRRQHGAGERVDISCQCPATEAAGTLKLARRLRVAPPGRRGFRRQGWNICRAWLRWVGFPRQWRAFCRFGSPCHNFPRLFS